MSTLKLKVSSLSKYLAQAGVASRRKATDLIKSKIVTVNGIIVNEPGFKVTSSDCVKVGKQLVQSDAKIYILLNKPKNYITTVSDNLGRCNVLDLLEDDIKKRVYPVGRLDRNTTGLLLLTNDGDLTLHLSHPRFEVQKIYHVTLNKLFTKKDMITLLNGVTLEDGKVVIDQATFLEGKSKNFLSVTVHSGKYRVIRRVFAHLGYDVVKLDRIFYAGLQKNGLKIGDWRYLTSEEIAYLKQQQ